MVFGGFVTWCFAGNGFVSAHTAQEWAQRSDGVGDKSDCVERVAGVESNTLRAYHGKFEHISLV